jgi:hypothetical protein
MLERLKSLIGRNDGTRDAATPGADADRPRGPGAERRLRRACGAPRGLPPNAATDETEYLCRLGALSRRTGRWRTIERQREPS